MVFNPGHHVRIHARDELEELELYLQPHLGPSVTTTYAMDHAIRFSLLYEGRPQEFIRYLIAVRDLET